MMIEIGKEYKVTDGMIDIFDGETSVFAGLRVMVVDIYGYHIESGFDLAVKILDPDQFRANYDRLIGEGEFQYAENYFVELGVNENYVEKFGEGLYSEFSGGDLVEITEAIS